MRSVRAHPTHRRALSALTTAFLTVALVSLSAGFASAGIAPVLSADPVSSPTSPIVLAPGGTQQITVSNADGSKSSGALRVSLAETPTTAGFFIVSDGCTGLALGPRKSCRVTVGNGPTAPTQDETATLTVESKTPRASTISSSFVALDPLNLPPVANFDTYRVTVGTALTVPAPGPLANDTDPEGHPLSMIVTSGTTYGTLTFAPDGSFTYSSQVEPPGDGIDSFNYMANDDHSNSNLTLVDIIVVPA